MTDLALQPPFATEELNLLNLGTLGDQMTSATIGTGQRAVYAAPVAWKYDGPNGPCIIPNPEHPYWKGREFVTWLVKGGHPANRDGPWYRAQFLPQHPLYLGNLNGSASWSWFQGIEHELYNGHHEKEERLENLQLPVLPPGEKYAKLLKQQ